MTSGELRIIGADSPSAVEVKARHSGSYDAGDHGRRKFAPRFMVRQGYDDWYDCARRNGQRTGPHAMPPESKRKHQPYDAQTQQHGAGPHKELSGTHFPAI
jgi:hypothetical protein